ncbi:MULTISPECIES: hypothetical protein [Algibacter]|uniref:Uncharacterized protein n=1 Tax=Algibacter lectus TaxID=221126 RepID=A0A090WZQ4_9FLAO|nr:MULTISPECIES: hypothetical protein [Algibacter]MDO7137982.1 hypothetical protein [Algibacter lectus]GAL80899.1 hypothetical protein JCM19274_1525 [Algibacter lectus]
MKILIPVIILALSIYKVLTSFLLDEKYGVLFDMKINIWLYRGIWIIAGVSFAYNLFKIYKDKKQFGI